MRTILIVTLAVASFWGPMAAAGDGQTVSRPNILLLMTDQHAATAMSCAGNSEVKTPALDQLAADSAVARTGCLSGSELPIRVFHNLRTAQRAGVRSNCRGCDPSLPHSAFAKKRAPPDALKTAHKPSSSVRTIPRTGQRPHDKRGP